MTSIESALSERILVLDGAMGTAIQDLNLTADDFGGPDLEGCNEYLVITKPEAIQKIHEKYLESGCDIVETNTFGGTPLVLDEYGLGSRAREINLAAVRLAKAAAAKYQSAEKPRFVAGSVGPTTKAISVTGGVTFEQLIETFYVQLAALYEGGVDYFLFETCQDTRNIKAAFCAADRLFSDLKSKGLKEIPIAVSGTIEPMGTMLAGQSVDSLFVSLSNRPLLYIGLNCATGPEFMTDHIRSLAKLSPFRVGCVPNAGLPDEYGNYLETPEMVAHVLSRFVEQGWVNVLGGCCGTHAGHISALAKLAQSKKPHIPQPLKTSYLSGIDALEIQNEARPYIVGERTNVIGSKKFKELICQEKFEEAAEIARAQVKNGAHIIDACLANPDRDEFEDMRKFLDIATKKIRVPLMIDSTDEKVIEMSLTYSQGKAIINSINLEDGEERFEKVVPLAKRFGAALVVGTIDDDPDKGMAVTRERKLEVATRSFDLLTKKYGIAAEDIYWDPLVFPCATGDAQYVGSAVETIEGLRLIKEKYPQTKSVLGISNVSFGLPAAGREVLNSVFLYHCVQAGLDMAIVNAEKLVRFASIPTEERTLAEDLLWNRGADPIAAFAAFFRTKKTQAPVDRIKLPLDERLSRYIIEGSKDGLYADLDESLKNLKPLDIINGPLMRGMDEVGRLFNSNQLIVAEVLQSAEAMKAAVAHLEPHMEMSESSKRGKVLLATVKGDVHDIGKNLVEIILSNNGFEVINLGIKVLPEQLIQAARAHNPDIIGLSGLLVKSAQQMTITAEDFSKANISTPVLVGGAALSENFVDRQISKAYTTGTVAYASDAMNGLELAKIIVDPVQFEAFKTNLQERREQKIRNANAAPKKEVAQEKTVRSSEIEVLLPQSIPFPADFKRHVVRNTPIEQIWNFLNPLMLYGRHLGIKGGVVRQLEKLGSNREKISSLRLELERTEPKALQIYDAVQAVKEEFRGTPILDPAAVFQFIPAASSGNTLKLFEPLETRETTLSASLLKLKTEFRFPRQTAAGQLCLSDYVSPESADGSTPKDCIALFAVTAGKGVREMAEQLKNRGEYLKSHILQALALETAEAYAEYLHAQLRKTWGFADLPEMTMMERFQAKYRGKRYSFGYPACPRLDDQTQLFEILRPQEIGIQLTDGFMMDPEASVSAIVFHHPQATYFSVGTRESAEGAPGNDNRQS